MRKYLLGLTLAELLISLAIIGVIAIFTIPKIIIAQQNTQYKTSAKEVVAMISQAYKKHQMNGAVNSATDPLDLTPYMNFLAINTSATIDWAYTMGTLNCSAGLPCLLFPSGGMLRVNPTTFAGTSTTNAIYFHYDPDGRVTTGTTNGPGKGIVIFLYYDGKIRTYKDIEANTVSSDATRNPYPAADPPWFEW